MAGTKSGTCGCIGQRILCTLLIVFVVTTLVLAAVVTWFAVTDVEQTRFTEKNIRRAFPGYFLTVKEQKEFEAKFDKLPKHRVNETYNDTSGQCVVVTKNACTPSTPTRRRRDSDSPDCCFEYTAYVSNDSKANVAGVMRDLVQFVNMRQFFRTEICRESDACTGCTCYQEDDVETAVVLKSGVTMATVVYIDDVEIDWFYFPQCCKCI